MNKFSSTRILLVILVLLLFTSCSGSDEEKTKVRLALDWIPWSNHSGLYMAQDRGYFAEQGLDVEIYVPNDPATTLMSVGAGEDDFGLSYQSEVLIAGRAGVPITSIAALVQHPLNSIMSLQSSGITRPADLKGKTVGAYGVPSDAPLLETMLKADGLKLEEVELVNVGFDLVPALISKKVDAIIGAYWVAESISAENQGFSVNVLKMEDWGVPDFYEIVLVTSQKNASESKKLVQSFINALSKGYQDALEDPQEAINVLSRLVPETDEDTERQGINLLTPYWLDEKEIFGWQSDRKWEDFANWMISNDLLSGSDDGQSNWDFTKLYTNEFIEKKSTN